MNNQFSAKLLLVAALFISVLIGPAISARAQAISPTPTTTTVPAAPTVASTQAIATQAVTCCIFRSECCHICPISSKRNSAYRAI